VRKERIPDSSLIKAVVAAEAKPDADLGGGLIKQRIARQGQGKSGGYRTIIVFRRADRAIFVYGFAKNRKSNVSDIELRVLRRFADLYLNLGHEALARLIETGELVEVTDDVEKEL
jgi:hypothetical protein